MTTIEADKPASTADVTIEADKPFIIRTVTPHGIFNHYVPMASIEECRDFIAYARKTDAERRERTEAERKTAEYQQYASEVLAMTGFDPRRTDEIPREYVICRISYEVIES